ncbi:MAG: UbiA-like polyprenyltransferase [Rikenellaceae bacterium]
MMIKRYGELVKFSHTIFAMPFAMIGYALALTSGGYLFDWQLFVKIILCMVFARNCAMGFNRWADRKIDADNPRTANREIPAGVISARGALVFTLLNALLFVVVAATINSLTAWLSPVALLVVMGYSYAKRFTSLAHLILGLGLSIAPVGGYISVTGEFDIAPVLLALVVVCWCSGFDIIYALQDREYDRSVGLHSIPSRFSVGGALTISSLLHVVAAGVLILFGVMIGGEWWRWIGIALFIALLVMQHILVTPTKQRNIGIAFATLNGIASVVLAVFIILSMVVS